MTNKEKVEYILAHSLFLSDWENSFILLMDERMQRDANLSIREQIKLDVIYDEIVPD